MTQTPEPTHDRVRVGATRRYDSPLRRERAAQTRDSIISAGAELVHEFSSWDWRKLTIRAVAERAGVHERTVYRHFPTEQLLRAAVVSRLEQEAGVRAEDVTVTNVQEHVARLFHYLSSFSSSVEPVTDASLAAVDERRKAGVMAAVTAATPAWSDIDRRKAAAMIDVLWGVPTYRRLVSGWSLDADEATAAVNWTMGLLISALDGHPGGRGASPD